MLLVRMTLGLSAQHLLLLVIWVFSITLAALVPTVGMLIGWSAPVCALGMLPKRTFFSDPRAFGLGGLAFWSLREVGGTVWYGFPESSSSFEAVLYITLLSGCSALISATGRPNWTIVVEPPLYKPTLSAIKAAIALLLVIGYLSIQEQNEFFLPAHMMVAGTLCGGLICYRGSSLVISILALCAIWSWDVVNSYNRTGMLLIPALILLAIIFRISFFGRSKQLLKARYFLMACFLVAALVPFSVLTKETVWDDDYSVTERIERAFSGKMEFPFLADPVQYFDSFSSYRSSDTRGISILTQIALAPLPRSIFPWKPPDILHYLDTTGVGGFLYIETFLLPVADLGTFGAFFYSVLPVLLGYVALALIGGCRARYPVCYGMLVPIYYTIFLSQSGYPFAIAQYLLAPLTLLFFFRLFDRILIGLRPSAPAFGGISRT
jgi:hypothetical protein